VTFLEENDEISNVVVGFRDSGALYGDNVDHYPSVPHRVTLKVVGYEGAAEAELLNLYWENLLDLIKRLQLAGKKVFVLYPIPELPLHINKAISTCWIFGEKHVLELDKATSAEYYQQRHAFILKKLEQLEFGTNLIAVKTFDILCRQGYCPAVRNDKALYFDDDHLSLYGASVLVGDILTSSKTE
jgi:hypothetical protein